MPPVRRTGRWLRAAPLLLALSFAVAAIPREVLGEHSSSAFVSLARAEYNCSEMEYSYGTRCICTWEHICISNQCRFQSAPCGVKDLPFCIGKDTAARCISAAAVDPTNFERCVPNTMIERHCQCGSEICPASVFTTTPTFQLTVRNTCNNDLACVRDDYGSYTVFPFNGEITGADPAL